MKGLASSIQLNVMLQARNNLYTISIGLAVIIVFVLRFFFSIELLNIVLPTFILLSIGGTMYMFLAGLIIFEKTEHTLDGIIVTPLKIHTYLGAKIISLLVLALIEASIITLFSYGFGFNGFYLYSGIVLLSLIMVLIGIIQVVRYDSVTDFLVPAIIVGVISQLPAFVLLDFGTVNWLWYIIPTTAPYMLMLAGFQEMALWQLIYGIAYSVMWILLLSYWAHYAFERYIVQRGAA